jgi:hypothetical protein
VGNAIKLKFCSANDQTRNVRGLKVDLDGKNFSVTHLTHTLN